MGAIIEALKVARTLPPRTKVEVMRGLQVRIKDGNLPVLTLHYSAHPDRDPVTHPEWIKGKRPKYSSQGAWDREQEIKDRAGGGELVFADILLSHWKKIVITDPSFRPDSRWRIEAGFDHGAVNPTALERSYIDFQGNIILCGEYYMPGRQIWQNAETLKTMEDIRRIRNCYADPSIFPQANQQSDRKAPKSYNDLYVENGIALFSQFVGDRSDISFAQRVLSGHWANLGPSDRELDEMDERQREEVEASFRKPSLRIVCRNYDDKPQPDLHNWDCPNLLWEMLQTRKKKLSATQLMSQNPAEEIIDKNNHATDALKYLVMSLPEPSQKSAHDLAMEAIAHIPLEDVTSRAARYEEAIYSQQRSEEPVPMSKTAKRRMAMRKGRNS